MVFWKIFHAHSLKDTSQFLLKTTCGPCIFDFTGPNLRYPHVVFCWGQRWWKPLLGTSLVRSQCGGDVGFATSRCIGVSAIRSKVNQPKLQTWLVGEKTHWLHTVTFCLNLIYIYIYIYLQVIHIFALCDIYFDCILAIILSSPKPRQFCFIFRGLTVSMFSQLYSPAIRVSKNRRRSTTIWMFPKIVVPPNHPF